MQEQLEKLKLKKEQTEEMLKAKEESLKQEEELETRGREQEKQPMSAYFIFLNDRRAALLSENKNVLEVAKITGEEWKNMSEHHMNRTDGVEEQRTIIQYMQEMELYKQQMEH